VASHGRAREENRRLIEFTEYSLNQEGRAMKKRIFIAIAVSLLTIPMLSTAGQKTKNSSYSPYVGQDFPKNVYFGDTHLHTSVSLDAYGDGNTKVGPDGRSLGYRTGCRYTQEKDGPCHRQYGW
jgi:hypothetical protein